VALSPKRRINSRIGIHVGDVMVRAGDLFRDGVNIAARLQAVAQLGGVCVFGATYEQVWKVSADCVHRSRCAAGQEHRRASESLRARECGEVSAVPRATAETPKPLPLPEKPWLAVLPFQNMSDDPEHDNFADGMVEDITTTLSRFRICSSSRAIRASPTRVRLSISEVVGWRHVSLGTD
jgi:adenylate cyclase